MAVGALKTEADLNRHIEQQLMEKFGLLDFHRIQGAVSNNQLPQVLPFPEVSADPDAPDSGAVVYTVLNGATVELRARFANGTIKTITSDT